MQFFLHTGRSDISTFIAMCFTSFEFQRVNHALTGEPVIISWVLYRDRIRANPHQRTFQFYRNLPFYHQLSSKMLLSLWRKYPIQIGIVMRIGNAAMQDSRTMFDSFTERILEDIAELF